MAQPGEALMAGNTPGESPNGSTPRGSPAPKSATSSDLHSDELDQVATNLDRLHITETVKRTITGQEPDRTNPR
jgi:hypothetical protein